MTIVRNKESNLEVIAGPRTKPVSVAKARRYIGVGHTKDDSLIKDYITAATDYAELMIGEVFINRLCRYSLYELDSKIISLPLTPIHTIVEVKLFDYGHPDGMVLKKEMYEQLDDDTLLLMLVPLLGRHIEITYIAGHGTRATDVPSIFRQSILEHVDHLYQDRKHALSVPQSVKDFHSLYVDIKGGAYVCAI